MLMIRGPCETRSQAYSDQLDSSELKSLTPYKRDYAYPLIISIVIED